MWGKGKTRKNHPVAAHCWENMEEMNMEI